MAANYNGCTDEDLAGFIRSDDSGAFEALYQRYFDDLVAFAYRLSSSRAIAQDVVADLFVSLWQKRDIWQPKFGVRVYLYSGVRNRALNYIRNEQRAVARAEKAVADAQISSHTIDTQLELADQMDAIWHVIEGFPELRRTVMFLRWEKGLGPEEIAGALEISRNAVDQHLSRAMQALRETLPHLIAD